VIFLCFAAAGAPARAHELRGLRQLALTRSTRWPPSRGPSRPGSVAPRPGARRRSPSPTRPRRRAQTWRSSASSPATPRGTARVGSAAAGYQRVPALDPRTTLAPRIRGASWTWRQAARELWAAGAV